MELGAPGLAGLLALSRVTAESKQGPGCATNQGHIQKDFPVLEMPLMKFLATLVCAMLQVI